ncbi:hypothetical protein TeGR_g10600 [Tetraparma gracilis]|uniref:Uncharacterized protein n=1 Tax=Tetraparma gracilis TaxID=2962635 RepID=A0ABQ6MEQ9_9STRA|nr:hypothetical protein TeGR_g10600 [Tetraparma gracilis]
MDPAIRKDPWTPEEEETLMKCHAKFGNKWAEISRFIKGRTDNAIKNHFNSAKRRLLRIAVEGELDESKEDLSDPTNSMNRRNLYRASYGVGAGDGELPPRTLSDATKMLSKKYRRSDAGDDHDAGGSEPPKKRRARKDSPKSAASALSGMRSGTTSPCHGSPMHGSRAGSPYPPPIGDVAAMRASLSTEGEGLASVLASMRNSAVNSRCASPVHMAPGAGVPPVAIGGGIEVGKSVVVTTPKGGGAGAESTGAVLKVEGVGAAAEAAATAAAKKELGAGADRADAPTPPPVEGGGEPEKKMVSATTVNGAGEMVQVGNTVLPVPKKKRSLSLLSEIACPEWQGGGV